MSENNSINNTGLSKAQLYDWLKSGKSTSEYFDIPEDVPLFSNDQIRNEKGEHVVSQELLEILEAQGKTIDDNGMVVPLNSIRKTPAAPVNNSVQSGTSPQSPAKTSSAASSNKTNSENTNDTTMNDNVQKQISELENQIKQLQKQLKDLQDSLAKTANANGTASTENNNAPQTSSSNTQNTSGTAAVGNNRTPKTSSSSGAASAGNNNDEQKIKDLEKQVEELNKTINALKAANNNSNQAQIDSLQKQVNNLNTELQNLKRTYPSSTSYRNSSNYGSLRRTNDSDSNNGIRNTTNTVKDATNTVNSLINLVFSAYTLFHIDEIFHNSKDNFKIRFPFRF